MAKGLLHCCTLCCKGLTQYLVCRKGNQDSGGWGSIRAPPTHRCEGLGGGLVRLQCVQDMGAPHGGPLRQSCCFRRAQGTQFRLQLYLVVLSLGVCMNVYPLSCSSLPHSNHVDFDNLECSFFYTLLGFLPFFFLFLIDIAMRQSFCTHSCCKQAQSFVWQPSMTVTLPFVLCILFASSGHFFFLSHVNLPACLLIDHLLVPCHCKQRRMCPCFHVMSLPQGEHESQHVTHL